MWNLARIFKKLFGLKATGPTDSASETVAKNPEFSNFTPRVQQVLALSRREAARFNHNFVGTEHILLGIIALGHGTGAGAMRKLGLDLDALRSEVENLVGTGPDQKMIGNIPYTPRVKKVLALAAKEAKELNHTYVGTGHIFLGLLREGDGVAARVLKKLDVTLEQARAEVLRIYAVEPAPSVLPVEHIPALPPAQTSTRPAGVENMTPRAQQVLAMARREADRLHHNFVGTEHLLLGSFALNQAALPSAFFKSSVSIWKTSGLKSKKSSVPNQPGWQFLIPLTRLALKKS